MPDTDTSPELSDFEGLVGQTFVFSLEGVPEKLEGTLTKAKAISSPEQGPPGMRVPFVLDFRFPPGADLGQCLFQVESAAGKRFPPMYLVPRASDEEGWYMDATFH